MYILFISTIINRFGDFVMPFLTIYLTTKIGVGYTIAGIVVTIASLIGVPSSLLGGKFSDEHDRKKTYLWAQGLSAASLVPCAFISGPVPIVIFLMVHTFFGGAVRPCLSAIMTDLLPPSQRQQGFSLNYLGINIGVSLGPIVAGFLFENHLPWLFIGDALTSFIAIFLVYKYVHTASHSEINDGAFTEKETHAEGSTLSVLAKRPDIVMLLLINVVFSFIYTQHRFALPLSVAEVLGGASALKYGTLMSINAVTVVALTVFITASTKRFHPLVNATLGGICYAIGFGMIALIDSYPLFILSTVVWTIGEILMMTNFGVYIANHTPSNFRARFNAVNSLTHAVGAALGTALMGKYIEMLGLNPLWLLVFVLSILSSGAMYLVYKKDK